MEMDSSLALGIFDRIKLWKEVKDGVKTQYRLLYLECMRNLDLIDVLNFENGEGNDEDFKSIIKLLELDFIELTFFNSNNIEVLQKLTYSKVEYINEEDNSTSLRQNPLTSVYLKIKTVQKLVELEKKGKALKNINYKVRLKNIKSGLLKIVKILSKEKETVINKGLKLF